MARKKKAASRTTTGPKLNSALRSALKTADDALDALGHKPAAPDPSPGARKKPGR